MTVFVCAIPVLAHGVQKKERKKEKKKKQQKSLFAFLFALLTDTVVLIMAVVGELFHL